MAQMSQLEKLYSPSYWVKRCSPDEILEKYVKKTQNISDQVALEIPCTLDIPYGSAERQKYDIFGIDLPKGAPIFIFLHGGYWQEESITRQNSRYAARNLHKNGCKTIIIGYTLCPENTIFQIIEDVQTAVEICLEYAIENGSKAVSIGGHSAGAQIVVSLFPEFYTSLPVAQQQLIKSIYLIGGVYDITALTETIFNVPLKLTKTIARQLSPMFYDFTSVVGKQVKFFVYVGENDSPVFVEQSRAFLDIIKTQGLACVLQIFDELDHFDIVETLDEDNNYIISSIVRSLS